MKFNRALFYLLSSVLAFCFMSVAKAEAPVWVFTPSLIYPPTAAVSSTGTVDVEYTVTNKSVKRHNLVIKPITGVSQTAPCVVGPAGSPNQSCTLSLTIDGSALPATGLSGGPVLCQANGNGKPNPNQCYQPSKPNRLSITVEQVLSVSVMELALFVSGTPRLVTITNNGSGAANSVSYTPSPALPSGTTIFPVSCGTIPAAGTCQLTITPGAIPSQVPGDLSLTPITLSIAGTNTNTIAPKVNVLNYGSVYQGGYLFALDDSTPNTGSIGGKVLTLTNQATQLVDGVVWSSNGVGSAAANVSNDIIPGVGCGVANCIVGTPPYSAAQTSFNTTYSNELTFPFPPASAFQQCAGGTDGACNSANILALYGLYKTNFGVGPSPYVLAAGPTDPDFYAAGLCSQTIDGYADWYLPAVCEMGSAGAFSTCNGVSTENIADRLTDLIGVQTPSAPCAYANTNPGTVCLAGDYWSSTEFAGVPATIAAYQFFSSSLNSYTGGNKNLALGVRCARALTY